MAAAKNGIIAFGSGTFTNMEFRFFRDQKGSLLMKFYENARKNDFGLFSFLRMSEQEQQKSVILQAKFFLTTFLFMSAT